MATLYVDDQGASIRIRGQEVVVKKGEETLRTCPLHWLERVVLAGNVQLSTQAISLFLKEGIPISFITVHGNYRGRLLPGTHKHTALRLAQYERYRDPDFRLRQGKSLIEAKVRNSRTMLQKHHRSHPDFDCKAELAAMKGELEKVGMSESLAGLMGLEGTAAKIYFSAFGRMVRREFSFEHRSHRPPKDPVNALLSLGYTLLCNEMVTAVESIGFDPYLGYLHEIEYGRASLAVDLMEEFRWIIDGLALSLINRGEIGAGDFQESNENGIMLTDHGRKLFYSRYEERMNDEVLHRDKHESYRRVFLLQAEHF
ncbi:MAG: CRISPR-associated endonuclease Cas1 [Geobacteraceae bacterium]|nr:CRISPR-associated endonuclease Cas1 [Geobacteraceae bacterium]